MGRHVAPRHVDEDVIRQYELIDTKTAVGGLAVSRSSSRALVNLAAAHAAGRTGAAAGAFSGRAKSPPA
jgi:hypothetical protein